jgi:hypothetical protein
MREINVSRAGDPVNGGDKALTWETPAQRGLDSIKFLVFEKNYVSIFPYGPKSKICLAMVTILDFRSTKKLF